MANVSEDDHGPAGEAIRAALRPGERLREHSHLLRSPGLEQAPPGSAAMLNAFNPFAGFGRAARDEGVGKAVLGTAFGLTQQEYSPSELMAKDRLLRTYGQTFCGVPDSEAGRLLAALRRHANVEIGARPAWVALTDQRLVVLADPAPGPEELPHAHRPLRVLLHFAGRLAVSLWRLVSRTPRRERPQQRYGYSGAALSPIFECPATTVVTSPAPPAGPMPRVALTFADRSWLVVSLGTGAAAARLAAALGPDVPR
ncbi:hypothetical protein FHX34_102183 [Actinoplanes teichomyceticus]|uniref:Uncharacterized protein n=2 Tax=Actinoplanes teichomyceticus TaxID=1867 RepID=A0A561WIF5_ACTTI|nr:hypothetical protein FHX34_102183 [Actinoplanes teichomyceticus]